MKKFRIVFAFGLVYLISCNIENNSKEIIKNIFIGLPIDTLIENENLYYGFFDTVFYEHKSFEYKANEYRISSMFEESVEEGKTNFLIRLDAKYSNNKSIIAENQYLKFIKNNRFEPKRIEDYKSHTNTGMIIGKKFFKEESGNNPYLLISFLKDTTKDNIISFTYIRNAK